MGSRSRSRFILKTAEVQPQTPAGRRQGAKRHELPFQLESRGYGQERVGFARNSEPHHHTLTLYIVFFGSCLCYPAVEI